MIIMLKGDWVLPWYAMVCHSTPQYATARHSMPQYAMVHHGMSQYAMVCHGTPQCATVHMTLIAQIDWQKHLIPPRL